jgi:MoaA/NifB/PqqE/SkfB family radical SAM enzyme
MVFFAITSHCNASCTTCGFPQLPPAQRKHVDLDGAMKAIDRLAENGVRMISLTGGEPLLHPGFLDICRHIDRRGLMISYLATNGILLDDKTARALSELNLNIVGLSVDITDQNGIGRSRRYDVVQTVARAKRLLDGYGINNFAGVLPGKGPDDVRAVLDQCRRLGFSRAIFSYPQSAMGSSYRAAGALAGLDARQARSIVDEIRRQKSLGRPLIFNTEENLREFLAAAGGHPARFACPGGTRQFYLDWNLQLYRCFNDGQLLGNINDLESLDFDCDGCAGCTQQAFRDYASFYAAYDIVDGLRQGVFSADGKKLSTLLSRPNKFSAMSSLFEAWLGGFL